MLWRSFYALVLKIIGFKPINSWQKAKAMGFQQSLLFNGSIFGKNQRQNLRKWSQNKTRNDHNDPKESRTQGISLFKNVMDSMSRKYFGPGSNDWQKNSIFVIFSVIIFNPTVETLRHFYWVWKWSLIKPGWTRRLNTFWLHGHFRLTENWYFGIKNVINIKLWKVMAHKKSTKCIEGDQIDMILNTLKSKLMVFFRLMCF